jgi:hypothetical protein
MTQPYRVEDALASVTRALPASTTAVSNTTGIDLGAGTKSDFTARGELLLSAPLVTTGQLPDTKLFTYDIIDSVNADMSSPRILAPGVIVQTGAGAAGAAAATYRFKPPTNVRRYIAMRITPSASGTGDASAASATLKFMS